MSSVTFDISVFYKNDFIISLLFSQKKKMWKKCAIFILLFYSLPIVAFFLSLFRDLLIISGGTIGMLQDYLFLSFVLITIPFLFIALYNTLSNYKTFIEDMPSFCRLNNSLHFEKLLHEHKNFIKRRRIMVNILVFIIGMIAVASNVSSIANRVNGWNSISHPIVFATVSLHLFIVIGLILPNLLFKFLLIVSAQISIMKKLVRENLLNVRPLSPDGSGGLRSLGRLSLSYTYMLIPFLLTLSVQYFTWSHLTIGFYMGLLGFIPLTIFIFFYPLGVVHKSMDTTKRLIMKKLSDKYDVLNSSLLEHMDDSSWEGELPTRHVSLEILNKMYKIAEEMPVWPFNTNIMIRFSSITVIPFFIFLIQQLTDTGSILYNLEKIKALFK